MANEAELVIKIVDGGGSTVGGAPLSSFPSAGGSASAPGSARARAAKSEQESDDKTIEQLAAERIEARKKQAAIEAEIERQTGEKAKKASEQEAEQRNEDIRKESEKAAKAQQDEAKRRNADLSNAAQGVAGLAGGAAGEKASGIAFAAAAGNLATAGTLMIAAAVELKDAAVARANELAQYNGQIAAAQAQAERTRQQQAISSANRNSQDFSDLLKSQSRFTAALQDRVDDLLAGFGKAVAPILDAAADLLGGDNGAAAGQQFTNEASYFEALAAGNERDMARLEAVLSGRIAAAAAAPGRAAAAQVSVVTNKAMRLGLRATPGVGSIFDSLLSMIEN